MKVNKYTLNFKSNNNMSGSGLINRKRLKDSFVKMASIGTGSSNTSSTIPSTPSQLVLANRLAEELKKIGLDNVEVDKNGFVYGTLNSNLEYDSPSIGFLAHMDTYYDTPSDFVKPQIHDYKNGDIKLNSGVVIPSEDLKEYKNQTIITSDGTTLLGADDKAGIAEILEALRVFSENPKLLHPTLKIVFTPDEEIGKGIEHINLKKFDADVAYTVDGNRPNYIYTETFNANNPEIIIEGFSIHTGHAYKKLINSIKIANSIISMLPDNESPETTKDRSGFYHVESISGNVEKTVLKLCIRDFDKDKLKERLQFLKEVVEKVQKQNKGAKITLKEVNGYSNMKNGISKFNEVVDYAIEGINRTGMHACEVYSRGGTDGSDLTEMGLPTPNLGSGSVNYHSVKEFVSLDVMQKCCENIINTILVWGEKSKDIMPKIKEFRENKKIKNN